MLPSGLLHAGFIALALSVNATSEHITTRQRRTQPLRNASPAPPTPTIQAGAVLESGGPFTTVTATFTVPSASASAYVSTWLGIGFDGSCSTAGSYFIAGVDASGGTYDAWYEWYPNYAYDFSGITFSAGDSITVTVTATSTTAGTATVQNSTKGKTVTQHVSGSPSLCTASAGWILEESSAAAVSSFTFSKASAGGVGPSGATIVNNDTKEVKVTTTTSSVTITHILTPRL